MTPLELLEQLNEMTVEYRYEPMSVPQLYAVKATFERLFWDAYYDEKTPCPHTGTKWRLEDGKDRCGMCGRRIEQEAA
jgi:hypothetical protein